MTRTTTRPYERSHGRRPRGTGTWAFQLSTSDEAYTSQLRGEPRFYNGTYTEARRQAEAEMLDLSRQYWLALLP